MRVVNSAEAATIPAAGGAANFSLALAPNTSAGPGWRRADTLEWSAVFVNGQRCVQLPSSSLGLPGCGLPYSQLAADPAAADPVLDPAGMDPGGEKGRGGEGRGGGGCGVGVRWCGCKGRVGGVRW